MAAVREAVHLMTLPDAARAARLHDPFDNIPEGVEWVVASVEPGQSPWLDMQLQRTGSPKRSRQTLPARRTAAVPRSESPASSPGMGHDSAWLGGIMQSASSGSRPGARAWQGSRAGCGRGAESGGGAAVDQDESGRSEASLPEIRVIR